MENNTPQRESRVVLIILGTLLLCMCLLLVGMGFIVAARSDEIANAFQTQVAMPAPAMQRTLTAVYATSTAQATLPLIFFDDLSTSEKWETGEYDSEYTKESFVIQDGRLRSIHEVKKPFVNQSWIDAKRVGNFYFALDTQILAGAPNDQSGITFRAQDSNNHYTFTISNHSTYEVRREKDDTWAVLISSRFSEKIRPKEMNRLAVIAQGNHFTFFLNGAFVDELTDDAFKQGAVGIAYKLSEVGSHITLEYDNFELRAAPSSRELAQAATATAWQPTLTAVSQQPASFSDRFAQDQTSNGWATGSHQDKRIEGNRVIAEGVYRWDMTALQGVSWFAIPNGSTRANVLVRGRVKQGTGAPFSHLGIIFRYQDSNNYYKLSIRPDRKFRVSGRHAGEWTTYLEWDHSDAIHQHDWNALQVIAQDDQFYFWINDEYVGSMTSNRIGEGKAGLAIEMNAGNSERFEFDDFEMYPVASTKPPTSTPTPIIPSTWHTSLDESFNDKSRGWMVGETNTATERIVRKVLGGRYAWFALNTARDGEWLSFPNTDTLTNFFVSTKINGATDAQVGFVYRYIDQDNYYRFTVSREGSYRVDIKIKGEWKPLLKGLPKTTSQSNSSRQVGVLAQDNTFSLFIDGLRVATLQDNQLAHGQVGLVVTTPRGKTVDLSFDDFQIRVP